MGEDRGSGVANVIREYGSPTGRREGRHAGSANAMRDMAGDCSPSMAVVSSDGAGEGLAAGLDGENSDCDGDEGPAADSSTNPGGGAHGRTTARPACGTWKKWGKSTTQPKKNNLWTLEERIALARISGEDDALMADAEGAQQHMTRTRRYEWIPDRLADLGYLRTGEDFVGRSGQSSRRRRGGPQLEKFVEGESSSYMFGMASVMEESTWSLCEGLDKAAGNMAHATTEGVALMAAKMGDMAIEIGAVAGAMQQGNSVLEMMVGVMAGRGSGTGRVASDSQDTDPSTK
ncbi:hypothetical protein CBR_g18877 [Chara braunii]|uniref:Myb-like domain-containing protein n=1 Tax=Chara braunii TaxID=69332 RepID=A0A388KWM6_CHABU|nr:hypothetical protein CBR_g18877 [Chara braunii]|eukprot:GBG74466.1 hypothetical protein CBR_g18877 [Chara braunii]